MQAEARKRCLEAKNLTYDDADELAAWENSYTRMDTLLFMRIKMQREDWLKLVGEWWTCCDNIRRYRLYLKHFLGTEGPIPEMMKPEEQAAFDALPDILTVYRGCGPRNMLGASWTTNKMVAEKFPFLARYWVDEPLLVTGKVKKKNVLAYKLGRNENEIITFSARRVKVETAIMPADIAEKLEKMFKVAA
jgi:hypothetical protein